MLIRWSKKNPQKLWFATKKIRHGDWWKWKEQVWEQSWRSKSVDNFNNRFLLVLQKLIAKIIASFDILTSLLRIFKKINKMIKKACRSNPNFSWNFAWFKPLNQLWIGIWWLTGDSHRFDRVRSHQNRSGWFSERYLSYLSRWFDSFENSDENDAPGCEQWERHPPHCMARLVYRLRNIKRVSIPEVGCCTGFGAFFYGNCSRKNSL